LKKRLDSAIDALPEKCRLVFLLSRQEEMSYADIARELDISVKTVENQIGKALKLLRQAIAGHRG
jgi:RNA polymerase sigma-70 factor (ECF subfamily)